MFGGKIGIGELLCEIGFEIYWEIVDFGCEVFNVSVKEDGELEYVEVIYRIYVINIGGNLVI